MQILFGGIDPGKSGAVGLISSSSKIFLLEDCPVGEVAMADLIRKIDKEYPPEKYDLVFALERVGAIPAFGKPCPVCKRPKGVSSTAHFTFGKEVGKWEGILASFQISFLEPTPQTWQKGLLKKSDGDKRKQKFAVASRIFPTAELTGPRGGIKDGRCDALLIADWRRRQ